MSYKPRIAITIGVESSAWRAEDDRGRFLPYAASIRAAGGEPEMVGIEWSAEILAGPGRFLGRFDGLLLTGGGDVHPALYPNPPSFPGRDWDTVMAEYKVRVDEGRDAMELALAQCAHDIGRPTLGVCRGFQVMNVALGGQLILDLEGHRARPDRSSEEHPVRVLPGTRLHQILGGREVAQVNSRHHQGVDEPRVTPLLRPSAVTPDGALIEGLEAPHHPWFLAVQWHPERPEDAECHAICRPLFERFVDACRGRL